MGSGKKYVLTDVPENPEYAEVDDVVLQKGSEDAKELTKDQYERLEKVGAKLEESSGKSDSTGEGGQS